MVLVWGWVDNKNLHFWVNKFKKKIKKVAEQILKLVNYFFKHAMGERCSGSWVQILCRAPEIWETTRDRVLNTQQRPLFKISKEKMSN